VSWEHGLTRRQALQRGGAGVLALGLAGCGGTSGGRPGGAGGRAEGPGGGPGRRLEWILDMALDTPGEPPVQSAFKDPHTLARYGYDGRVVADWRPPTAAVTYESLDPGLLPRGSDARAWIDATAAQIDATTRALRAAGLKALYHTDMILLPNALVDRYGAELKDARGRISLERELTRRVVRIALAEAFARFPHLDGLVVRTGELYLQDLPYHTGDDPITSGPASHVALVELLRTEACERRGKLILYRTWGFDGFTTSPPYYLSVASRVAPHPLLAFAIKHTAGDFWRTVPFNPTLGIGGHKQVVEVECAREYEGKGAHPNYIAHGVIDGFEEEPAGAGPTGLAALAGKPTFAGVLTWSRGGGWRGPHIEDELWCELNAWVVSRWAQDRGPSEQTVFAQWAAEQGVEGAAASRVRRLALLSARAILHGHYSTVLRLRNLAWMRDEFLGGSDEDLAADFASIAHRRVGARVLQEKAQASALWREITALASSIALADGARTRYLRTSSRYGALLYAIVGHGWEVMLRGVEGDRSGRYDRAAMAASIAAYDSAWRAYSALEGAATRYVPFSFLPADGPRSDPGIDRLHGMGPSVGRYRRMLEGSRPPRSPASAPGPSGASVGAPTGRAGRPSATRG
jgi:hypothetical protein